MAHDMDKLPPLPEEEEEVQVPVEFQDMMTGVDLSGVEAEMPPVELDDLPLEAAPLPDFPEVAEEAARDTGFEDVSFQPDTTELPDQPAEQPTDGSTELVEAMNKVATLLEELPVRLAAEMASLTEIG